MRRNPGVTHLRPCRSTLTSFASFASITLETNRNFSRYFVLPSPSDRNECWHSECNEGTYRSATGSGGSTRAHGTLQEKHKTDRRRLTRWIGQVACSETTEPPGGSIVIDIRLAVEPQRDESSVMVRDGGSYHGPLHHAHLSAAGLLIEASGHLSSKVLQRSKQTGSEGSVGEVVTRRPARAERAASEPHSTEWMEADDPDSPLRVPLVQVGRRLRGSRGCRAPHLFHEVQYFPREKVSR
ncbi:hypothetical protein EYF80_016625 [Liparis tanakae]|uniref:Uncharacterized protein n=1 Tax=Liparis tanakae TaxID=230148 RepID=A0A4Z2I504_9TELE|nr:hypothetical protein EYF80_016625 [Liparis tanakae]